MADRIAATGGALLTLFVAFLVGRDGTVLKRYAPTDEPSAIEPDVARMLV